VRLRSDRKFRRLGVSGFTTAAQSNVAFGNCYGGSSLTAETFDLVFNRSNDAALPRTTRTLKIGVEL
ncbi:hypothetical protein, partial [Pseudomonas sp. 2024-204]|uniref:hypothetical protein n=1 Tax=Pseudomonas sp. 2024-204 TaxID=3378861 RepID=UPI00385E09E8